MNKECFIIMPIADTEGYDTGHFDRVYEQVIKPAVKKAGFTPVRADDNDKSNYIMEDIIEKILKCEMCLCDISSLNSNVLYELGIRQAWFKPVAIIKDKNTTPGFDIKTIRYKSYDEDLRIDNVKRAVKDIANMIKETYDNNVTVLSNSVKNIKNGLNEIFNGISSSEIEGIVSYMNNEEYVGNNDENYELNDVIDDIFNSIGKEED